MARGLTPVAAALLLALAAATAAATATPRLDLPLQVPYVDSVDELPTSFAAMIVCGGIFVAGLPIDVVIAEDCDQPCNSVNVTADYDEMSVTAIDAATGAYPFKAIYRGDGLGCTTVDGITEAELRAQDVGDQSPLPALNASAPWPLGEALAARPPDVDWDTVEAVIDADFRCLRCNTRAVTIAYRGELVYARYKSGVTKDTRLIGWSATKSVTSTFVGVLAGEGRLTPEQRAPVPEWTAEPDDPRAEVTIENLLNMASGQMWREQPGDIACLFTEADGDCAGWYANLPQEVPPGTRFEYSTGDTTLLMRTVLQQRGDPEWTHFEWPRQKLFKRLSMTSALIEAQSNGYLLGGSNGYMTSADWTRLGLLYARDGVWVTGERVLPEGWVEYISTPSASNPSYGGNFWLGEVAGAKFILMAGVRYAARRACRWERRGMQT